MRLKLRLAYVILMASALPLAAEDPLSIEFWQWFGEFSGDDAAVFDPLMFDAINTLTASESTSGSDVREEATAYRDHERKVEDTQ